MDDVDVDRLRRLLEATVAGPVAFDAGTRALYATDASNYRRVPLAVVLPRDTDDVIAAVAACRESEAPIVPRGGGTSVAGNACGGVVLDTSRYLNRVVEVDPDRRTARVDPGAVLDDLCAAAARFGLTFGPDPSTHSRCTIGGMIGNNACGSHSVAWGTTADNVEELDVLLADGTRLTVGRTAPAELERLVRGGDREAAVYAGLRDLVDRHAPLIRERLPDLPRRVSGYGLDALLPERGFHVARALVGSEGTCAIVLGASVRLVAPPPARVLLVFGYPDLAAAGDAVPAILPHGPLAVEGMDERLVASHTVGGPGRSLRLPDGHAWLLVEMGADTTGDATGRARDLAATLDPGPRAHIVADPHEQRAIWLIREEGAGLATRMADGSEAWPGWEDAAVPPERIGSYLRAFDRLLERHERHGLVYGHLGEGCVHIRIDFELTTPSGVAGFRRFVEDAADLVAQHGGSLSGEHGDGRARSELLERMYGPQVVGVFEEFKSIWDPDNRLNPGIVVQPHRIDEDLRLGSAYQPRPLPTVLGYPRDHGSLAEASRRCVGVGKCLQRTGGVMCPSYRVTRDERHSTRGRARLLFEMLNGELITDGWRSQEVRDALDLCLACKGCKSDCPVNVDMATYKAEFLHHHYARRPRPASHYSMGFLPLWARLAAVAPSLVNRTMRSRLAPVIKSLAGIAPERRLPAFAPEPFVGWFRRHRVDAGQDRRPVLLWPDTFTNFFTPEVARAATEVLEAAGFRVVLPAGPVCCGLTWISTGQLGVAKRVARRTLRTLRPALAEGMPIVGLEPSCTAVLRSDLRELLPHDDLAALVAERTSTLAELLTVHAAGWTPPRLDQRSITQPHCHQHAILGFAADERVMALAGLDNTTLDAGCCGLAGNFGFERGHYAVSKACGELALLPAVRAAPDDTLVIADGFSCRLQIEQESRRRAIHLAEVLKLALDGLGRESTS